MIVLKASCELAAMRVAGGILVNALKLTSQAVEPDVSTWEIDRIVRHYIRSRSAKSSSLGYSRSPASACISVSNVIIHGVSGKGLILGHDDTVSIDIGAFYGGLTGDNAYTSACGDTSPEAQRLMDTTRESLCGGIRAAKASNRVGGIDHMVQTYIEAHGYSVVYDFVGHGAGAKLHEDPSVPNLDTPGRGVRLLPGIMITVEPVMNAGVHIVKVLLNGWTTVTTDGKLATHYEHLIVITADGPVILTLPD